MEKRKIDYTKAELVYTASYCEENIWKLVEKLAQEKSDKVDLKQLYVVFISNETRSIPIWYQSKSECEEIPVVWDYHVILVHKDETARQSYVYDFDTVLNFPETFETYTQRALIELPNIKNKYKRNYKLVAAEYYLKTFASDRSHMLIKETGKYIAEPPVYPCIANENSDNNIQDFISMFLPQNASQMSTDHGNVVNQQELEKIFTFISQDLD